MKTAICLFAQIVLFFFLAQTIRADEISELKEQITAMQQRIEVLEKNRSAKTETATPETGAGESPAVWQEKIGDLEEEVVFLRERQESFFQKLDDLVHINLYATLEYESFENTNQTFDARNIELLGNARLTSRLTAGFEIEFERTAVTSAGDRQGEVEVEQGWVEYRINRYFNPRLGVVLVPFGKFNLEHFDPMRDLTARPIAMRRVVPTTWGEAGAGFTGDLSLGELLKSGGDWMLDMNYQFYLINGLTDAFSDTGMRGARGAFGTDNNNNLAAVGRLGIVPFANQEIGLSMYYGDYDENDGSLSGFDVDWDFILGPLELIGEYAFFNPENGGLQNGSSTLRVPDALRGGYIQANYHFWFDVLNETFLGRDFSSPTMTLVLRYGEARIEDDADAGTGDNDEERWTVGINYRPVEAMVFKFEYQFNDTNNEALERGGNDGFLASVSAVF